jgi:hypothetical protein
MLVYLYTDKGEESRREKGRVRVVGYIFNEVNFFYPINEEK